MPSSTCKRVGLKIARGPSVARLLFVFLFITFFKKNLMQSAGLSDTVHHGCAGCKPQLVLKVNKWIVLHSVTNQTRCVSNITSNPWNERKRDDWAWWTIEMQEILFVMMLELKLAASKNNLGWWIVLLRSLNSPFLMESETMTAAWCLHASQAGSAYLMVINIRLASSQLCPGKCS